MNIGLKDGILDRKHIDSMGPAVWLYLWCIRHQTKSTGLVLGGSPITYAKINQRLEMPVRTLQRWMSILKCRGYLEVTHLNFRMMKIRVLKSKKFDYKQAPISFPAHPPAINGGKVPPKVADTPAINGGTKQSVIRRKIESKAEAGDSAATLQAFDSLSSTPFGPAEFKNRWTEQYQSMNGGGFTEAMEKTIIECQSRSIKVPGMFFTLKRQVEKIEIANKFHRTPL